MQAIIFGQSKMRESAKPPVRGKTSPYGFFVKMCYEEHKKKYPNENVQVTEISKKCSEKWKVIVLQPVYPLYLRVKIAKLGEIVDEQDSVQRKINFEG